MSRVQPNEPRVRFRVRLGSINEPRQQRCTPAREPPLRVRRGTLALRETNPINEPRQTNPEPSDSYWNYGRGSTKPTYSFHVSIQARVHC